jgi:translocation and assembly module TamB
VDGAGGYLPAAGIRLEDVALTARLGDGKIEIEKLQVKSGEGRLRGEGKINLDGFVPADFRFELEGENFRAVNLPELQLSVSPNLELRGRGRDWRVTGKVEVAEALVRGPQGKAPVTSSPDLVIVDAPAEEKKEIPLTLAVRVTVTLGDHVLVKAQGIDARLTGEIEVEGQSLERLTGQGRLEVAEGHYAAYGVRLKITRGSLVFAGGPIDRPTLDVLAVRTAGEVEAGIRVTGTPRAPVVKLYSEPAMPDTDVLAYIVLGHPVGGDSGQAGLLMGAAATLLSQGESAVLQDRIKRQLGIDVLDVQAGNGDVTQSVVTVGKYLSPELYVSFGQSIFTNTSQVGLRYDLDRHWQVESTMGTESGVDLYYRITFD